MTPSIASALVDVASGIVSHWSTDVAYDVEVVCNAAEGESFLWEVRKTGTWMARLFFSVNYGRFDDMLASMLVHPSRANHSLFLVRKVNSGVEITPTTYAEMAHLS
jgi:hypothetical protein